MTNSQRRAERQARQDAEAYAREEERYRVESLSLWERIEEAESIEDIKAILHIIAEKANLE